MCIAIRDLRSAVSREATITICKVVHTRSLWQDTIHLCVYHELFFRQIDQSLKLSCYRPSWTHPMRIIRINLTLPSTAVWSSRKPFRWVCGRICAGAAASSGHQREGYCWLSESVHPLPHQNIPLQDSHPKVCMVACPSHARSWNEGMMHGDYGLENVWAWIPHLLR